MNLEPRMDSRESGTTPESAKRVPSPDAISFMRGEQIKAEWRAITSRWLETASYWDAEEWAETFAPDHPEWFTEGAA